MMLFVVDEEQFYQFQMCLYKICFVSCGKLYLKKIREQKSQSISDFLLH